MRLKSILVCIIVCLFLYTTNVYAESLYDSLYDSIIVDKNISIQFEEPIDQQELAIIANTFLGRYATDTIYFNGISYSANSVTFNKDILYSGMTDYELTRRKNEIITATKSIIDICENKSDIEKAEILYDYLSDNTEYYAYSNNIYDLIVNHKGNCVANARTYTWLLYQVGIESIHIHNDTHEWNQVNIDNNWYHVDVSWKNKDKYFLKSDKSFEQHHNGWYSINICNIDYNQPKSIKSIITTQQTTQQVITKNTKITSTTNIDTNLNTKVKNLYNRINRNNKSIKLKRNFTNSKLVSAFNHKYLYYYDQSCVIKQTKKYFYLMNKKQLKKAIKINNKINNKIKDKLKV